MGKYESRGQWRRAAIANAERDNGRLAIFSERPYKETDDKVVRGCFDLFCFIDDVGLDVDIDKIDLIEHLIAGTGNVRVETDRFYEGGKDCYFCDKEIFLVGPGEDDANVRVIMDYRTPHSGLSYHVHDKCLAIREDGIDAGA